MFNEEIKRRFIEEYTTGDQSQEYVEQVFRQYSKLEEKYVKDIYYIPYDIIINDIFEVTRLYSYKTYYEYIHKLQQYKKWCLINNIFPDYTPMDFDIVSRESLKNNYEAHMKELIFRSFNDLHEFIDDVLEIKESKYMTKPEFMKMFVLLLYSGIPIDDLFKIKIWDIKDARNEVFISNDDIMIKVEDKELAELLLKRRHAGLYEVNRGRRIDEVSLGDLIINYGKDDVEYVHRQTKAEFKRYLSVYNKSNNADKAIDLFTLYVCGVIRQIKQDEETNNYKIRVKDLYEWFAKNNHGEEVKTQGRKKIIKTVYTNW